MDEAIIGRLRDLGFSLYEARVYVALLRHGAQNGNELSKRSGVPSSKVYSTVEKLVTEGVVHSIRRNSTTQFVCIGPDELIARLRKQYNDPLDSLSQTLPSIAAYEPTEVFMTVSGLTAIRESSRAIIDRATRVVQLSSWADDIDHLRAPIEAAAERAVRIYGMLYGPEDSFPPGSWLRHSYEDIVANRVGGRMLTVVADDEEALVARIPWEGEATGVRTRSRVLALVTREYLHHDIVLQRAQIKIGFDQWDQWWQADPDLRSVILGTALEGDAADEAAGVDGAPERRQGG